MVPPEQDRCRCFHGACCVIPVLAVVTGGVDIHVMPYPQDMRVKCSICREELESKSALMNQAERVHGTVSRQLLSALGSIEIL
jgi:hypothetical protein